MSDVKWIKIVTDIFDDEKILLIESMPEADSLIVIWFKLLCLAGKNNNSGVFTLSDKIPYTEEMFSTIFRRNINTVRLALGTFEQFGMIEIVDGVITIPNWGKHQNFDRLEAKTNYMRGYMRDYREKQKALIGGSSKCKTNSKANSKANVSEADKIRLDKNKNIKNSCAKEADALFSRLWDLYPVKRGKNDVKKTQREKLLKIGFDEMARAIERYTSEQQAKGTELRYYKQGSTFFNGAYADYLDNNFRELSPQGKISKQIDYENQEIF